MAPREKQDAKDSAPAKPSLIARLRELVAVRREQPLRAAGLLSLAAVALVSLVTGLTWFVQGLLNRPPEDPPLTRALKHLDQGELPEAKQVANQMRAELPLDFQSLGGPIYVLGAVAAADAAQAANDEEQVMLFLIAARYLEEARDRGFPEGREADGLYLLGKTLYLGHEYHDAVNVLQSALPINQEHRSEILRMLAEGSVWQKQPDHKGAVEFARQFLAIESLSPPERHAMLAIECDALFELGDLSASRQVAESVPDDSKSRSAVIVSLGHGLLREADSLAKNSNTAEAVQRLKSAIELLRSVQAREAVVTDAVRHSQYLLGRCYRRLAELEPPGDLRAAEVQFARTRRAYFGTQEGLAAGLDEAELQRLRQAFDPALSSYLRVLQEAGKPDEYHNRWISLEEFRNRVSAAFSDLRDRNQFEQAIGLTKAMQPLFPAEQPTQWRAETEQRWAEQLHSQATGLPAAKAEVLHAQSRAQWRAAGESNEQLASLRRATREYPDDLWRSADAYLRGRSYDMALRMLGRYLQDGPTTGRARALVARGEALLARDRLDEVLRPLEECIEFFPKSPEVYRARLLASAARLELDQPEQARRLLEDNLFSEDLSPRSAEWRDSLFLLGELQFEAGTRLDTASRTREVSSLQPEERRAALKELEKSHAQYTAAVRTLTEAVTRYPDAAKGTHAKYLLAEAQRRMARLPRKKLEFETIETTRSALRRQHEQDLTEAITGFTTLQEKLNQQQEASDIDDLQRLILRNCYFGRADALFDLSRYEDAIQAYSAASNRYLSEPAALEAFAQMATCYRLLNKPIEARGQLEQAKVVLGRIRPDADFVRTTRFNRDEWNELLNWLAAL